MNRRAIRAFPSLPDFRREPVPSQFLEQIFFFEAAQLQSRRKAVAKLDEAMIKKRKPSFHRMRHTHAVALRREQVLRQENSALQILRPFERPPAHELSRIVNAVPAAGN